DIVAAARKITRHGHAETGGDGCGRMRRAERIVLALGTLGETRQPAFLSQCPDAISPAGQYLVRIGLVADIPDQPVVWRIENVMQRNGQFDHAEAGAEMPTRLRYRVNELCAKLARKLR